MPSIHSSSSGNLTGFRWEYQHTLMVLIGAATICFAILLSGCSSSLPGMPNIYLLSFSYQSLSSADGGEFVDKNITSLYKSLIDNASLTVRIGYFGFCISSEDKHWICNRAASTLRESINTTQDPFDLMTMATNFRDKVIFSGLIFICLIAGALCSALFLAFPQWQKEFDEDGTEQDIRLFPDRVLIHSILMILGGTVLLGLASVLWQHIAAVAAASTAQSMTFGFLDIVIGSVALGLGWTAWVLYTVTFFWFLTMYLSIKLLDELVDD